MSYYNDFFQRFQLNNNNILSTPPDITQIYHCNFIKIFKIFFKLRNLLYLKKDNLQLVSRFITFI